MPHSSWKKTISLIFFVSLLISLPISVYTVITQRMLFQKKAVEKIEEKREVTPPFSQAPRPEYIPGEVIVKFRSKPQLRKGVDDLRVATQFSSVNTVLKEFKIETIKPLLKEEQKAPLLENIVKIKLEDKQKAPIYPQGLKKNFYLEATSQSRLIERLKTDPNIEYAEPNYLYWTELTPNDPLLSQQWSISKIQAIDGWDIETGSSEVVIAVVDTGLDYNHEDLQNKIWLNEKEIPGNNIDDDGNGYIDDLQGWDFVNVSSDFCAPGEDCVDEDNDPSDFLGHGTHVAGITAASSNNGKGIAGICWHCQVMNLRVGWKTPDGNGGVDMEAAVKALTYAADNGANVINMSFGGPEFSAIFNDVLRYTYNKDVILITSAGNDGSQSSNFPASSQYVLSVAATDNSDQKAAFSNYGNNIDLAAPGVNILSLRAAGSDMYGDGQHIVDDKYYLASGTSMSAPIVAGVFGLVKSLHSDWKPQEIEKIVRLITDSPASDFQIGYGRVNLYKTVTTSIPDAEAALTNPYENSHQILPFGPEIQIIGRAKGESYKTEFGEGIYPQEWKEIYRQDAPVNTGGSSAKLATWQTSYLEEKLYTLKLTVFDSQGRYYYSLANLQFYDPSLGWERQLSSSYFSAPTVADLNNDGEKEIIVVSAQEIFSNVLNLYVFNSDGRDFFSQNPIKLEGGRGFTASPAVGDLDADGLSEIVVTGENKLEYPFRSEGIIYILKNDGSLLPGWNPRRVSDGISLESRWCYGWGFDRPCGGFPSSPALADIDNDGRQEIILLSRYGKLYIFNIEGDNLFGFPKLLGEEFWFGNTFNTPAVGDIDGDNKLEIVAALGQNNQPEEGTFVYLIENDGAISPGWPKKIVGDYIQYADYSGLYCPPTIGDVNQDGKMEIFISSYNEQGGKIHGWKDNGSPINDNWPVFAPGVMRNVILGRFNQASDPIIFAGAYKQGINAAYAFFPSGMSLSGWPPPDSPQLIFGEPLVVDIDGDGNQEAVFLSENISQAFAYEESGQQTNDWPIYIKERSFRTPVITDLDKDGFMEIAVIGSGGKVYVRKLPKAPISKPDWGHFRHDERHTGAWTPSALPGDLDGDGNVDEQDAKILLENWGTPTNPKADLNLDAIVNALDFGQLIQLIKQKISSLLKINS